MPIHYSLFRTNEEGTTCRNQAGPWRHCAVFRTSRGGTTPAEVSYLESRCGSPVLYCRCVLTGGSRGSRPLAAGTGRTARDELRLMAED